MAGELNPFLRQFGITGVDNALPTANPAILAFLRGMGMTWESFDDARRQRLGQIATQTDLAKADTEKAAHRQRRSLTADTVLRGQMGSGLADTRAGELTSDVNDRLGRIDLGAAEQTAGVEFGRRTGQDAIRQQVLERLLQEREGQDVEKARQAEAKAQADRERQWWDQQTAAANKARADNAALVAEQQRRVDAFMRLLMAGQQRPGPTPTGIPFGNGTPYGNNAPYVNPNPPPAPRAFGNGTPYGNGAPYMNPNPGAASPPAMIPTKPGANPLMPALVKPSPKPAPKPAPRRPPMKFSYPR